MEGQELEQAIEALKGLDFVVRTKQEDESFTQSQINTALGNQYQKFDDDIFQSTGIKKADGETPEKTYSYLKRAMSEVTSKSEELKKMNKDLSDNIEVLKTSGGSQEEYEKKVQDLMKKHTAEVEQFKDKLSQKDSDNFAMLKNAEIDASMRGMSASLSKEVDDNVASGFLAHVSDQVKSIPSKRSEDGKLVFYESDGVTPITSSQDGHLLTLDEILKEKLTPILAKQISQEGMGGKTPAEGGNQVKPKFTTKQDLDEYLVGEGGFVRGSQEWIKERSELIKSNSL